MELLDIEALFVRAHAVHKMLRNGQLRGIDALALVVAPPTGLLEASKEIAERRGISEEAIQLNNTPPDMSGDTRAATWCSAPSPSRVPSRGSSTQPPSPPESLIVTLDELVATL
jgi:hypothetical protein